MKKMIFLSTILLASGYLNAEYLLNVNLKDQKNSIIVDSPFDSFGFDENGIHRSGETTDSEGFRADGRKADDNSNVNQSLNQELSTEYNLTMTQDIIEGNFGYLTGTLSFSTEGITVQTVDSNIVVADEGLTSNPFPNGIQIIRNGTVENNTSNATSWEYIDEVYENVSEYYWTDYEFIHTRDRRASTNPDVAHGTLMEQANFTATRWRYYANRNYPRENWPDRDDLFLYMTDSWASSRRTRTVERLVSSTREDYYIISSLTQGDVIDVYMPIRLQVSIDGGLYEDVELTRDSVGSNSVTFELENLNARELRFRVTDLNHSTRFVDLTGVNIQPEMLRN